MGSIITDLNSVSLGDFGKTTFPGSFVPSSRYKMLYSPKLFICHLWKGAVEKSKLRFFEHGNSKMQDSMLIATFKEDTSRSTPDHFSTESTNRY